MGCYLVTAWAENGQAFQIIVEPSFNRNNAIALAKKFLDKEELPLELGNFNAERIDKNEWYSSEMFDPIEPDNVDENLASDREKVFLLS